MKLARFHRAYNNVRHTLKPNISKKACIAAVLSVIGISAAHALPVLPGAAGFGMETRGGRGGKVYRVTNVNASGSGSLKACIDASGPRTCVFDVSGSIRISSDLTIRNGNLHIAGQTAPSPGIMIRGAAIKITTSDVVIQHLRVRTGDDTNGPDPTNRDSLKIEGTSAKPVKNIVIDHCSFSWAIDEIASTWGPHDNITFSNNVFAEPLNDSGHLQYDGSGTMRHGYGILLGTSSGSSISMIGNLFAHQVERNPLTRAAEFVFVNNVVYDRGTMDLDVQAEGSRSSRNSVVGNVFIDGPSLARDTKPIYIRTSGNLKLGSSSRAYLWDNISPSYGISLNNLMVLTGGNTISGLISTTTAPVWNSGLVARSTAGNAVYERVLLNAGARPKDRDSVDRRIVSEVRARTGKIINCVAANGTTRCQKNGGGWPSYAQNRRVLTLPANYASTASNGYSNLENWLHNLDVGVSGVPVTLSPSSPSSLSVQ
jgi:pectate lyase